MKRNNIISNIIGISLVAAVHACAPTHIPPLDQRFPIAREQATPFSTPTSDCVQDGQDNVYCIPKATLVRDSRFPTEGTHFSITNRNTRYECIDTQDRVLCYLNTHQ